MNGLDTVSYPEACNDQLVTAGVVAWDVTANISFGRHYGFIDQEKDVDSLITDSTKGLEYFAPVSLTPPFQPTVSHPTDSDSDRFLKSPGLIIS
jgi:hypothetical protein